MQNKNLKMLPLFESSFSKKLSYSDKGKNPLEILKSYTNSTNSNKLESLVTVNLKALKLFNSDLINYILKWNYKNLITDLTNNAVSKTSNNRKDNINLKNSLINNKFRNNINTKIELQNKYNIDSNLKNNIPLPINLIGTEGIKESQINLIKLITNFNTEIVKFKNNSYNFNFNNNKLIQNIYSILEHSFNSMSSLISKPYFSITSEKVVIHLFFFLISKSNKKINKLTLRNNKNSKKNKNPKIIPNKDEETFLTINKTKLNKLCELLSKKFNKPVELDLVRLYYPFYDPNILVNAFGLIVNKIKLRFILKRLFKVAIIKNPTRNIIKKRFSYIPSYLSGINLKIAGRLMTQRVVPRKTVKITQKGSLARRKAIFVENARFTNKNKRGSFSISVSTGYFL